VKGGIFMFLHLGENVVVPIKDVIGIFDMETAADSTDTIQFLRMAEEDGFVQRITREKPKSLIIAEVNKKSKIFLSPISSSTLGKRTESIYDEV
jgi:extracellular matrix regulatory protein B